MPSRCRGSLAIAEYPELLAVIRSGQPLLIDDAATHPSTQPVAETLAARNIAGIAVLPVQWRGRPLGAILLRKRTVGVGHLGVRGLELAKLIASITAAHLRHGPVLE